MWNPCQVATENVNSERSRHEDRADPEAPVTMHALPVGAGLRFAAVAAISFMVVLASGHLFSITASAMAHVAREHGEPIRRFCQPFFPRRFVTLNPPAPSAGEILVVVRTLTRISI
jgi:hypothetical protein